MGPVCLDKRRGILRLLTQAIEIKGSGFPLRRERRGWSCAPILTSPSRRKEDILDAPACVYDAIARLKNPFSLGGTGLIRGLYLSPSPRSSPIQGRIGGQDGCFEIVSKSGKL